MAEERLQKILSRAGIASRRAAETLILEGRVEVNGKVVRELGSRADPSRDVIRVEDKVIAEPEDLVHFVLYKPERVVTTLEDPEGRTSVGDLIRRARVKVYPVGRLDYDAEGALLLTNDGALAHKLTHPRWGVPRTYLAKVKGVPAEGALERMRAGVRLEDGEARALEASFEKQTPKNAWIRLVVAEGRHHLVKRLCEAVGHPVVRLFRSDYGGVGVAGMHPGDLRPLAPAELQGLRKAVEKEAPLPPGGRPRRRTGRTQVAVRDPIYGTTRPAGGGFSRVAGPRSATRGEGAGGFSRGAGRRTSARSEGGEFARGERPRASARGESGDRFSRGAGRRTSTRSEGGEFARGERPRTSARGEGAGGLSRGAAPRRPSSRSESGAVRTGAPRAGGRSTTAPAGARAPKATTRSAGAPSRNGSKRPAAPGSRTGPRAGSRPRGPAKPRR